MRPSGGPHFFILSVGLSISAVLLTRFASDFAAQMSALFSIPFIALVASSLFVISRNIFTAPSSPTDRLERAAFLAAIPFAFIASSLDCMGLSLKGGSTFCSFVKLVWIPLIAVACIAQLLIGKRWLLILASLMSFVPVWPHCVCYNAGNGWWMEMMGKSPMCYAWGLVVSLISVSAIRRGGNRRASLTVSGAIIAGAMAFFVSHHYFHFPW